MAPSFHSLTPEARTEPVCAMVDRFCAGDDGVDALWHSCAPAAVCAAAAAFLACSCALEECLLDSESCGRAGWLPPFCGQAEPWFLSMKVQWKLMDVRFWAGTEMRSQGRES